MSWKNNITFSFLLLLTEKKDVMCAQVFKYKINRSKIDEIISGCGDRLYYIHVDVLILSDISKLVSSMCLKVNEKMAKQSDTTMALNFYLISLAVYVLNFNTTDKTPPSSSSAPSRDVNIPVDLIGGSIYKLRCDDPDDMANAIRCAKAITYRIQDDGYPTSALRYGRVKEIIHDTENFLSVVW